MYICIYDIHLYIGLHVPESGLTSPADSRNHRWPLKPLLWSTWLLKHFTAGKMWPSPLGYLLVAQGTALSASRLDKANSHPAQSSAVPARQTGWSRLFIRFPMEDLLDASWFPHSGAQSKKNSLSGKKWSGKSWEFEGWVGPLDIFRL
jgi:hypothetical protein